LYKFCVWKIDCHILDELTNINGSVVMPNSREKSDNDNKYQWYKYIFLRKKWQKTIGFWNHEPKSRDRKHQTTDALSLIIILTIFSIYNKIYKNGKPTTYSHLPQSHRTYNIKSTIPETNEQTKLKQIDQRMEW
jgi:hypothetical protein